MNGRGQRSVPRSKPESSTLTELPKTSVPATSALATIGVTRLEQLTAFSEAEILALHGMGPKALRILREALAAKGLGFRARGAEPQKRGTQ